MSLRRGIWVQGGFCQDCENEKECLFLDSKDYEEFLFLIENCMLNFDFKVHSYCLMPYYYNLLTEAGDESMFEAVSWLNEAYARFYNSRYDYCARISTNKFQALPANDQEYLVLASKHVHLDPVKEKLVEQPEEYRWSSYSTYIYGKQDGITYRNQVMESFDNNPVYYQRFVAEA